MALYSPHNGEAMAVRTLCVLMAGAALIASAPARAGDQLKFGAAPAWVVAQAIPPASEKTKDKPAVLLLHDQQVLLEPGKISTFAEMAFKIQKPEGLAAGNLSVVWNPTTDSVTVNSLEVRRGDQVIDVLKSGQTFTTMRRESNLELATLDGMLTANIQPEGLQEGDLLMLATTTEHVDPVLKGHVETTFAPWGETQFGLAHARLAWPSNLGLKIQKTGDLPAPQESVRDGKKVYELTMRDIDPVIDPKGAPVRFKIGRLGGATDFGSWADAAKLLTPLFRDASVIPTSGPLRNEVEKIHTASTDPKVRTEQALQLVQQRVRYVALLMGQGGLVPAPAETTWSRRYGDCKAKTALLLGILHELGIKAEAVAANPILGDAIAGQLPMIGLFNHVLVRAHVGDKDYWLDGTRTGDTSLDQIEVPDFGWGLPLTDNAQLVHLVPAPLDMPRVEHRVNVDASAGVFAPAMVTIEEVQRGDAAVELNTLYSALSSEQRDEQLSEKAKGYFDDFAVSSSSLNFDRAKRELNIKIKGTAKLGWKDSWLYVPTSSIAFIPDFDRPAGPRHDVPWAVSHPRYVKDHVTIRLPAGFAAQQKLHPAVHETLAGVDYARSETVSGDMLTVESSERSITPEVPYKDVLTAAPRLKALDKDDVYLRITGGYHHTSGDLAVLAAGKPMSAYDYVERGSAYLSAKRFDEAIADFTDSLAIDPKNVPVLMMRAYARVDKGDFDGAEKDASAAESVDPAYEGIPQVRTLIAYRRGDWPSVVEAATKMLSLRPKEGTGYAERADAFYHLGKYDEALEDSNQSIALSNINPGLRLMRANIFMRSNREAVPAEAEAMMRENPTSDFAFVAAGKIYAALGQTEKAMQALDRALAIKPYAYIYINRAQVRPKSDLAGRMADLDAALRLEPNNADALAIKAQFLTSNGDFKGALAVLDQMKPDPNNRYAEMQRGVLLYKVGRSTDAQKVFADVRSRAKSANELNSLCWEKATAGVVLESALQDCRDALKLSPDTGQYLDSLGMALLKLGKLDEALDAYNKAVAKNTGAASLMGRALVYLRKGDRAHAEADAAAARKQSESIDDTFADYGLKFEEKSAAASH